MNLETLTQSPKISRRNLIAGAAGVGLGAALLRDRIDVAKVQAADTPKHLMWVWQFSTDGEPNLVASKLQRHGLGIIMKTHDGLQWMSEYDKSVYAVSGPAQTAVLANYYEKAGVPFHAWCVVHGDNAVAEARMAADVLAAGARSIYLDIEPGSGFWRGTPADAVAFGRELRRLQPNATVVLSIDSRPWQLERLPMNEFAAYSNILAPQQYWRTFNTQANFDRFAQVGMPVPPEGVTPEFLVNVSHQVLGRFGLPIEQTGQGATPDGTEFQRFIDASYAAGGPTVTVTSWRYGVTTDDIFGLMRDNPPKLPPPPALVSAGGTSGVHVVQSGDTLGAIGATYGVSVDAIMQANNLSDANYIYVGQELAIPGLERTTIHATGPVTVQGNNTAAGGGGRQYTVESGDTLYGIAGKFGTTVDAIAGASGLSNPNVLSIGQVLTIP